MGRVSLIVSFFTINACDNSSENKLEREFGNQQDFSSGEEIETIIANDFLIYFQKNGDNYDCMKKVLPDGGESLIAQFTIMPSDLVYDQERENVYFVLEKGVFKKDCKNQLSPLEKLSDVLPEPIDYYFGEAWLDEKSGKFCISYGISENQFSKAQQKKFKQLTSNQTDSFDNWGVNMFACIAELQTSGKWKIIHEELTTGEACDTPGLDVLIDNIKTRNRSVSSNLEISKSTYYGKILHNEDRGYEILDSINFKNYFKNTELSNDDEIQVIPIDDKRSLFAVVSFFGTTPAYRLPIYLFDKEKKQVTELVKMKKAQSDHDYSVTGYPVVGITITSDYLFVNSVYEEDESILIDIHTMKRFNHLPTSSRAFLIDLEN